RARLEIAREEVTPEAALRGLVPCADGEEEHLHADVAHGVDVEDEIGDDERSAALVEEDVLADVREAVDAANAEALDRSFRGERRERNGLYFLLEPGSAEDARIRPALHRAREEEVVDAARSDDRVDLAERFDLRSARVVDRER